MIQHVHHTNSYQLILEVVFHVIAAQHLLDLTLHLLWLLVLAVRIPTWYILSLLLISNFALFNSIIKSLKTQEINIRTHTFLSLPMYFGTILLIKLETLYILISLDNVNRQLAKCYLVVCYVYLSLVLVLRFQNLEITRMFVYHF